MTASWWYLGVSVYGALFTLNAYRPLRLGGPGIVGSFFASWLTIELAAHHLIWQVVATGVFAWLGAFGHWAGWVGLAVTLASWAGLAGLVQRARASGDVCEAALADGLGPAYHESLDEALLGRHAVTVPRKPLVTAFRFGHRDVLWTKNLSYGPEGRRNLLDVWHHRERPGDRPVLVWVHGGAWIVGHKAQQALPMIFEFAAQGWVVVSPNYRLSPEATFPEHLVDVKRALAWVREHVAEYGGDPEFVTISGSSAGGHLASLASLTPGDPEYQQGFEGADTSVQACVPLYGVYDLTNRFGSRPRFEGWGYQRFLEKNVMKVSPSDDPDAWTRASPYDRIHAGAPPFFVVHGTHDVLAPVGDARHFTARLREVSAEPVAYAELPVTQHAFDNFHSLRTSHTIRAVERFSTWCYQRHLERTNEASRAGTRSVGPVSHSRSG